MALLDSTVPKDGSTGADPGGGGLGGYPPPFGAQEQTILVNKNDEMQINHSDRVNREYSTYLEKKAKQHCLLHSLHDGGI